MKQKQDITNQEMNSMLNDIAGETVRPELLNAFKDNRVFIPQGIKLVDIAIPLLTAMAKAFDNNSETIHNSYIVVEVSSDGTMDILFYEKVDTDNLAKENKMSVKQYLDKISNDKNKFKLN